MMARVRRSVRCVYFAAVVFGVGLGGMLQYNEVSTAFVWRWGNYDWHSQHSSCRLTGPRSCVRVHSPRAL